MKKITFFICLALYSFILFQYSYAQVPNYWNSNITSGGENSFPMNQPAGKGCQWLVRAGEFNQPVPAPPNNVIYSISFRISSLYPLPSGTYTNFKIILQQSNITDLPAGTWYTGGNPDTVYYRASLTTNSGAGWLTFVLDHAYEYNPTISLIIQLEQCSWTGSGGNSLCHITLSGNRRTFSVGGCPIAPYNSVQSNVAVIGLELINGINPFFPNYIYYKFKCNPALSSIYQCSYYINHIGTLTAPIASMLITNGGQFGQFDSCIQGTGETGGGIITGWNCDLAHSNWTLSMWISIPTESDTQSYYLFGDSGAGGFRCFHNGQAGHNNLMLKGPFNDILINGIGPNPTVVTIVNDTTSHHIKIYKNGSVYDSLNQTINLPLGTGFKVGGYSTFRTIKGKLDEFRIWRAALTSNNILNNWNSDPGGCGIGWCYTEINQNNNIIPKTYILEQNYPNPFNPVTNIKFGLPKSSHVKLVVFDITGKEIEVLVKEFLNAGNYTADFDATELASGVYLYQLEAEGFKDCRKMVLIR